MSTVEGYQLGSLLGIGGFGETFRAKKGGKSYALKLIKEEVIAQGFDTKRFSRECRALEKVRHKNVVELIEYGQTVVGRQNRFYLVMELLDGDDLDKFLRHRNYKVSECDVKDIFRQVIDGLEAMHVKNILHRDIKPQNIFVTTNGTVKLLDFGLVKMIDYSTLTLTGEGPHGTPLFISPEAIRGDELDHRTDFYSLGVMLYHAVTKGAYPFDAQNILQLINMVLNEPPEYPSVHNRNISNDLENLILMLLSKQPFARIVRHSELRNAIEGIKFNVTTHPKKKHEQKALAKQCWFRLLPGEQSVVRGAIDADLHVDGIEFVANLVPRYRKSLEILSSGNVPYFFDPATNRLPYSTFAQTKGLVNLPYCWDKFNRLTTDKLKDIANLQRYAKEVVDWQAKWSTHFFVAPFHYHNQLNDSWLEADLKLLNETIDYCRKTYKGSKVFSGICCNLEEYTVENNRIALLNRFSRQTPDGFIFYGDGISETSTNPAILYAYARLLRLFSRTGKPIVGARLGTLGLGILAAGADIVTTGIAALTAFSENALLEKRQINYKIQKKYYIPSLMLSLPVPLAQSLLSKDRSLACTCSVCSGSPISALEKIAKTHYIAVRANEIAELNRTNPSAHQNFFVQKTKDALSSCKSIARKIVELTPSYYTHLNAWIEVFSTLKEEDDREI